jgi:hypothetical protein
MRSLFLSAALAALLLACSPPTQREAEPSPEEPPQVQACNDVAADMGRLVRVEDELAAAAAAASLRGGSITPGLYDLTRAMRVGQAPGWQGERAVALSVAEDAAGVVSFNWASTPSGGGETDRWTATFSDAGEHPTLSYTCGRMGDVAAEFSAQANALTLRVPDGANGSLHLDFQRRS